MRRVLQRFGTRQIELSGSEAPPDIRQPFAVYRAHAGHDLAGGRIDDVAARIDRDERRNDEPVRKSDGGTANAALHRALAASHLANRRAGAGADVALDDRTVRGRRRGEKPAFGGRTDLGVADAEVEEDRAGHDRDESAAELETDAALLEVPHDAAGRIEAEGAAASEHDRVHLLDACRRREQIGLARAGRAAADIDASRRPLLREDDRAPGGPFRQRVVTDLETRHGRQSA